MKHERTKYYKKSVFCVDRYICREYTSHMFGLLVRRRKKEPLETKEKCVWIKKINREERRTKEPTKQTDILKLLNTCHYISAWI